YKTDLVFALIPTITSISRQSLLSGKLPVELESPFNLSKEKQLFISKCIENGYRENQIKYYRGYDIDINRGDKCICVIINDIDDLVHGQIQGKQGMYNDISYLAKTDKIQNLIQKLCERGFNVYITSDHGNTSSICIGNPRGNGVEVESKCKRALIYRDFADYKKIKEEYNLIEYPGAYLPKEYKYLICETSKSFGVKGQQIMTHGGINIEEVIVPFVTIDRRSCL
ncbi:PglZ domain-containing protein, partial [Methanosarcina mazei]